MARRRKRGGISPRTIPPCDPALQGFYEEWFLPLVRRAIWQHNLNPDDARDIVQDAFVLALNKVDMTKNPKLWLRQVVDNLAMNLIRKTRRRKRLLQSWGDATIVDVERQEDE